MDAEQTRQLLVFKSGEADAITFFYHEGDDSQTPIDISLAELNFQVKKRKTGEVVLEKTDPDFDKSQGSSGLTSVILQKDDTKDIAAGRYVSEIRAIFDADDSIDKSVDIDFIVIAPVHKDA